MIIEFAGMPRSGKTTIISLLSQKLNNSISHFERFDLIPFKINDSYNYNFWYAQYYVKELLKATNKKGLHLFDRGIIDRIAFGNALAKYHRWNKKQHQDYFSILKPYVNYHEIVFIRNIKPEDSLKRVKKIKNKVNITHDLNFLKVLHQSYQDLEGQYKKLIYLPINLRPKELTPIALDTLEKIVKSS